MKRNTAILVGLALLCGVGVTIVELGPQRVRQQQQLQEQQLLTITAEEVEGLEIQEGNLEASLAKDDSDRWQILEPVEAPAESLVVQSMITVLTSADAPAITDNTDTSSANEDASSPDALEAFGLSVPQQTIALHHAGGTSTISIGGLTFDDTGQYVQVDNGPVRVLDTALTSQLSTSLFALRDKSLVDWTAERVQALTVIGPDETVELEQQEGNWQLSDRPDALLSDEAIADTLSQTQFLQASHFVTETQENVAEYGLESPSLQIEVTLIDDSIQTIAVGDPLPGTPTARHAMSSQRTGIVAIETSTLEAIATTELEFRDRSLGQLSSPLIGEIAISSPDLSQDITLSPSTAPDSAADQWDISGQSERTIAIEEFLIPLRDARANAFLPADDPTAASLLNNSPLTIRVSPVDGIANDPLTLEFSPGDEVLYARTSHIPDEILTLDRQFYDLLTAAIGTLEPST
ncbi:MAG: DUF4340 domain-containing protein [Cyanobacteria bacterium P01_E01_bin.34]